MSYDEIRSQSIWGKKLHTNLIVLIIGQIGVCTISNSVISYSQLEWIFISNVIVHTFSEVGKTCMCLEFYSNLTVYIVE